VDEAWHPPQNTANPQTTEETELSPWQTQIFYWHKSAQVIEGHGSFEGVSSKLMDPIILFTVMADVEDVDAEMDEIWLPPNKKFKADVTAMLKFKDDLTAKDSPSLEIQNIEEKGLNGKSSTAN
jgi:hypothetical protein